MRAVIRVDLYSDVSFQTLVPIISAMFLKSDGFIARIHLGKSPSKKKNKPLKTWKVVG